MNWWGLSWLSLHFLIFNYSRFFWRTLTINMTAGEGRWPSSFLSINSTYSQKLKHLHLHNWHAYLAFLMTAHEIARILHHEVYPLLGINICLNVHYLMPVNEIRCYQFLKHSGFEFTSIIALVLKTHRLPKWKLTFSWPLQKKVK